MKLALPLCVICALLIPTLVFAAPPTAPAATSGTLPFPWGVADAAGKRAYVSNPQLGVDAVDLDTGQTLWSSKEPCRPLAIWGDRLLTFTEGKGSIVIVQLDAAKGGIAAQSESLPLPQGVTPQNGIGSTFEASATVDGDALVLKWRFVKHWMGGTPRRDANRSRQ